MFLADDKARTRAGCQLPVKSEDYPRHMREVFDVILMGRTG